MITHIKELINHKTTTELFEYFKEQLIELYNQLSICESIDSNKFIEFLQRSNVYLYVNESMKIIGAITALYERKMIHNGGIVCHIEDFVVHEEFRNQHIGKRLLEHVIEDAKHKKCYKIILDCDENMYSYYHKYGFDTKNIQMSYYIE